MLDALIRIPGKQNANSADFEPLQGQDGDLLQDECAANREALRINIFEDAESVGIRLDFDLLATSGAYVSVGLMGKDQYSSLPVCSEGILVPRIFLGQSQRLDRSCCVSSSRED